MKVKTSELTGQALDYAVCLAKGLTLKHSAKHPKHAGWYVELEGGLKGEIPPWSLSWAYGGRLIEQYGINLNHSAMQWYGSFDAVFTGKPIEEQGRTPLEAVCRALVAYLKGSEVEIPDAMMPKKEN